MRLVKEEWDKPSAYQPMSKRVDNLYKTHGDDTTFLVKHPLPNSFIVDGTQMKARHRSASAPSNKEGCKLDVLGRRHYSLASFIFRVSNYVAAMGAYNWHLWNKLQPCLDSLPDEHKQRALVFHQEALSLACQERFAAKHIANAAAKQLASAISLR